MSDETLIGVQYVGGAARPMVPLGDGRSIIFERDGDAVGCPESFVEAIVGRADFKITGDKFARPYTEHPEEPPRRAQVPSNYDEDAAGGDTAGVVPKAPTIADLKVIAETRGVDLAGAKKKADIERILAEAPVEPDPASSQQDTPQDDESAGGDDTHNDAGTGE